VFSRADLEIVAGTYSDTNESDREALFQYLIRKPSTVSPFSGEIVVQDGRAQNQTDFTLLHARSVAEDVVFFRSGAELNEVLQITNGRPVDFTVRMEGRSLLHSVPLTSVAFSRGLFGELGPYIVTIALLLFAFSTAIAWSYYGDRAIIYLFGARAVTPYRLLYIAGFFLAAQADTTIIWNISAVTLFFMAMPNLFGILLLRKDMKQTVSDYWQRIEDLNRKN
jgi:AGCS family alanine or glycine:cation symporter